MKVNTHAREGIVYTGDVADFAALTAFFPALRVFFGLSKAAPGSSSRQKNRPPARSAPARSSSRRLIVSLPSGTAKMGRHDSDDARKCGT